jgi:hypothetical protein
LIARSPDDKYHDSRKYTARKATNTIVEIMYRRNFRILAVICIVLDLILFSQDDELKRRRGRGGGRRRRRRRRRRVKKGKWKKKD